MTKMNPEIKARWVAALRSGEYQQGSDYLRRGNGFCCLGVLCDLHAKETGEKWEVDQSYQGQRFGPGIKVAQWAYGTASTTAAFNAQVDIRGQRAYLSTHNDGGCTFEEIADAIEAQL